MSTKTNKKIIILIISFIFVTGDAFSIFKNQKDKSSEPGFVENEILVKFKPEIKLEKQTMGKGETGLKNFEALNHKFDATKIEKLQKVHQVLKNNTQRIEQWHKITFSKKSDIKHIIKEYEKDPSVEYAQPNYKRHILFVPDDPYYSSSGAWGQSYRDMWGLEKIQIEQAWDITKGSSNIIVAVIDTGLDITHPEIMGNYVAGWNFCQNNNNIYDNHGHGMHVSGIIAARGNNSEGIVGIAYNCKIMPIKALDVFGEGYDSNLAAAIVYAANNGARVINMSWGGEKKEYVVAQILIDAIAYAYQQGCVLVAAAGNSNKEVAEVYPANNPDVITVASTDRNDNRTWYSNKGPGLDVSAPGGSNYDILSLRSSNTNMVGYIVNTEYYRAQGTSMACPHVAGVAALMLSVNPGLSNDRVRALICSSADDLGASGWDQYYGYGRVNALNALQAVSRNEPIILHTALSDTYTTIQYLITASIEDFDDTVSSATLYWSAVSPVTFNELEMTSSYSTVYSTYIPGQPQGTDLYYYITATDSSGNTAREPEVGIYSFRILVDNSLPAIVHTPISDTPKTNGYSINAVITDNAGIEDAYVYWNIISSQPPFNQVKMTVKYKTNVYVAMIPGQSIGTTAYYYLTADDINYNSVQLPESDYFSFVIIEDTSPPVVSIVSSTDTFRINNHRLKAEIIDDNLVKEAYLYWNTTGVDPFNEVEMDVLDNDIYGADVTAQKTGDTVYYYIITTDYDDNTRREPPAGTYTVKYRPAREVLLVNGSLSEDTTYYTEPLIANWYSFDIINSRLENPPDADELKLFEVVIWFTGRASYGKTLSEDNVNNLEEYLNAGGKLFLSGTDIAYDLHFYPHSVWGEGFFTDYLHAKYVRNSSGVSNVKGIEEDITQGRSLNIYFSGGDSAYMNYSPDDVNPVGEARSIFKYVLVSVVQNQQQSEHDVRINSEDIFLSNTAGLCYENPIYRVVYLAFGFEGIYGASNRELLMKNILSWLKSQPPSWETKLLCSYPNPAIDDKITFAYYVETQSNSEIYVYNLAGELVKKLEVDNPGKGIQTVEWDIRGIAPGVYVYYIKTTLPNNEIITVEPKKLAISYR